MEKQASEVKSFSKDLLGIIASEAQDMTRETIKAMNEEAAIASEFASHMAQAYSVKGWSSAAEVYWVHQADLYRRWWGRLIDHQRRVLRKVSETATVAPAAHSDAASVGEAQST